MIDDYLTLITSWHRGKPRFCDTVSLSTMPFKEFRDFVSSIPAAFDKDYSIGVQLDQVGQWVGITRFVDLPIENIFFSLDDPSRGLDRGYLKGPHDSDSGVTRLDDDSYRMLINAKIAANNWDGSIPSAKEALDKFFGDDIGITNEDGVFWLDENNIPILDVGTRMYIEDNQDMSMIFGITGKIPTLMYLMMFSGGYIPLKPAGVNARYLVTSVGGRPIFGLDMNNDYIGGLDHGAWGAPASVVIETGIF